MQKTKSEYNVITLIPKYLKIEILKDWNIEFLENMLTQSISYGILLHDNHSEGVPTIWCKGYNVTRHVGVIRLKNEYDTNYFAYLLQSSPYQRKIAISTIGSAQPVINLRDLSKFILIIPTIDEQQKISSIISNIDNFIESQNKIIDLTKKLKTGLMQTLLTKGIGHKKFKKVKWLFGKKLEIPEEWEIKQLSELCDNKNDIVAGPFGSNLLVDDYVEKGTPILRLQNIQRNNFINKNIKFVSKHKAEELKYHSYLPGDIILAKLGDPIGKTCVVPDNFPSGIVVADVVRIRVSNKNADKIFVEYVLNSNACKKQHIMEKIGTTRPRVNLEQIRKLIFPCPPIKEQKDISSIFLSMDSKIIDLNHKKYCLENLKKGLMQKLLSGKIRVKV